jgi:hypothetical protein
MLEHGRQRQRISDGGERLVDRHAWTSRGNLNSASLGSRK